MDKKVNDANINKTKIDKMKELHIPEEKWIAFTDTAVDFIYSKMRDANAIRSKEEEGLLYFLNKILTTLGFDHIYNIVDFSVDRSNIVKLNGEVFVNDNHDKLVEYGIHLNNDLYYAHRKKMKAYGLSVLKGICKFFKFKLVSKIKLITKQGEKYNMSYYIVCKQDDTSASK